MKGAIADPWLKTIKIPKRTSTINIGKSQYFFLSFKNSQNSFKNDIIKTAFS